MLTFEICSSNKDYIAVTVQGYERAAIGEFYDDNWLNVVVEINSGAFRGRFFASFQVFEFSDFYDQLQLLYDTLKGKAIFSTLEGQLEISITCNALGNLEVSGFAMDEAGIGNQLNFQFQLDQAYLPKILGELATIVNLFPIRNA